MRLLWKTVSSSLIFLAGFMMTEASIAQENPPVKKVYYACSEVSCTNQYRPLSSFYFFQRFNKPFFRYH